MLFCQQSRWFNVQRVRNPCQDQHGRVPHAALNPGNIGSVQVGCQGQVFLGPLPFAPEALDVEPYLFPDIHPKEWTLL